MYMLPPYDVQTSVIQCNKEKYTKASSDLLHNASFSCISSDDKEWVCKTCEATTSNGLQLSEIPPELCGLNALELRLISLRVHCHPVNKGEYMVQLWMCHPRLIPFVMIELTGVMRQRGDSTFSELLCRVRTNSCTSDGIKTLKSREIPAHVVNYPTQALHVYRLNAHVDTRNTFMLNNLAPQDTIIATDSVASQTSHISLISVTQKIWNRWSSQY